MSETHRHTTAIWGKLVGIAQQIADNLAHLINIERHDKLLKVEVNTNCILLLPNTWKERQMFSIKDTTSTWVKVELTTVLLYLSEVEYLVDEIEKAFGVTMDERGLALLVLIVFPLDHADQRRGSSRWNGATKLMAHIGKEVRAQVRSTPYLS